MQLTLYTDYSLRVLIYLGINTERQATITEIAKDYGISRNHLVKVVHNLGSLGYIRTTRGRNGGLWLARPAEEINVGEVVRRTEAHFNLVECFDIEHNTCPIASVCALIRPLKEARSAFLQVLDAYTIADVVANRRQLAKLLNPEMLDPAAVAS